MPAFRPGRASTLAPSILAFASILGSGSRLVGGPTDGEPLPLQSPSSQSTGAPAPAKSSDAPSPAKSTVQKQLEMLYQRDHRPMPDYMNKNSPAPSAVPVETSGTAQRGSADFLAPAQPANNSNQSPANRPVYRSQGNINNQLSDYYSSQGKSLPQASGANNKTGYRQAVSTDTAQNQSSATAQSTAAEPKPRLIDRFNIFRRPAPKTVAASAPDGPAALPSESKQQNAQSRYFLRRRDQTPSPSSAGDRSAAANPTNGPADGTSDSSAAPMPLPRATLYRQPAQGHISVNLGASQSVNDHPQPEPTISAPDPKRSVFEEKVAAERTPAPVRPQYQAPAPGPSDAPNPFLEVSETEADRQPDAVLNLNLDDRGTTSTGPAATAPTPAVEPAAEPAAEPAVPPPSQPQQLPQPQPQQLPQPQAQTQAPAIANPLVSAQPAKPAVSATAAEPPHAAEHPAPSRQPAAVHAISQQPAGEATTPRTFTQSPQATELAHRPQEPSTKMQKIAERVGKTGLKGFCPVALRDDRELVDAKPMYTSTFDSKTYTFSSADAKARFDHCPARYAPIGGGIDIVVKWNSEQVVEGALDYAVWYKDRLYLFSSPESQEAFSLNPRPYAASYKHPN